MSLVFIHYRVPRPSWQASYRRRKVLRKAADLFLRLRDVGGGAQSGPDVLPRIPTLCDATILLSLDGKGAVWLGLPTRPLPPRESLSKAADGRPGAAQTSSPRKLRTFHGTEAHFPLWQAGCPPIQQPLLHFFPANRTLLPWVAICPATGNES